MQLQINTTGAWRKVLDFEARERRRVLQALAILMSVAPDAKWCLLHDGGRREWLDDIRPNRSVA